MDGLLVVTNFWNDLVIESLIELVKICHTYDKPAALCLSNAAKLTIEIREKHRLPIFESPQEAARALKISNQYYGHLNEDFPCTFPQKTLKNK